GKTLTLEDYAKLLSFEQYVLEVGQIERRQRNLASMNNLRDEVGKNPELQESPQFSPQSLARIEQQMEGALLQERSELGPQTLTKLVAGELLRREVERRGVTLTAEDLIEARLRLFNLHDQPPEEAQAGSATTPTVEATQPMTPTASPTPQPTPTPTRAERSDRARAQEQSLLALLKTMSPEEFERLVVIPTAYQLTLDRVLRDAVPGTAEQVHARHILQDREDEARQVRERLVAGEDFAALAKELSKDTTTADKGGDLDWQPREAFVKEFADAVFSHPLDEISQPVKSAFGYHVFQVLGREVRPLSADTRKGLQNIALDRLLREQTDPGSGLVTYTIAADAQVWARGYLQRRQGSGLLSFLRG
ncbi:MAG: peptidylprolyl isomerase, partial [Chloroflexi bacterium]|nr:peptidylprolyl isomerase [Chloroflexota bacterium]